MSQQYADLLPIHREYRRSAVLFPISFSSVTPDTPRSGTEYDSSAETTMQGTSRILDAVMKESALRSINTEPYQTRSTHNSWLANPDNKFPSPHKRLWPDHEGQFAVPEHLRMDSREPFDEIPAMTQACFESPDRELSKRALSPFERITFTKTNTLESQAPEPDSRVDMMMSTKRTKRLVHYPSSIGSLATTVTPKATPRRLQGQAEFKRGLASVEIDSPVKFRHRVRGASIEHGTLPRSTIERQPNEAPSPFASKSKVEKLLGEELSVSRVSSSSGCSQIFYSPIVTKVGHRPASSSEFAYRTCIADVPRRFHSVQGNINAFLASPSFSRHIRSSFCPSWIRYSDTGDLAGHPVILIPGIGYTRFVAVFLDKTAKSLGLRIICVDGAGQHGSDNELTDGLLDYSAAITAVCQRLGLSQYSIVAHSVGAMYALQLADKHAQLIKGPIYLLAPVLTCSSFRGERARSYAQDTVLYERSNRTLCVPHVRPDKCCLVMPKMHVLLNKPTNEHTTVEVKLARTLWSASTCPADLSIGSICLQKAVVPEELSQSSAQFSAWYVKGDQRITFDDTERLAAVLPNCQVIVQEDTAKIKHEEILVAPVLMKDILERICLEL